MPLFVLIRAGLEYQNSILISKQIIKVTYSNLDRKSLPDTFGFSKDLF